MTPAELLQIHDDDVRRTFPTRLPPGWTGEIDGPLIRCLTGREGFAMLTEPADDLSFSELEAAVERTVRFYRKHSTTFEWKTFDHDRADLLPLLLDAGAVPQDHEALVLGEAGLLADAPVLPPGIELRQVATRADLERIAALEGEVWGEDWSWMADDLASRLTAAEPIHVFVAEDTAVGDVVSAAWLTPMRGTRVAGRSSSGSACAWSEGPGPTSSDDLRPEGRRSGAPPRATAD